MPTFDSNLYQLLAVVVVAFLLLILIWIVRRKPYVEVRVLWLVRIILRDAPPEEPKKPRKKKDVSK